jgi:hypothetical protein
MRRHYSLCLLLVVVTMSLMLSACGSNDEKKTDLKRAEEKSAEAKPRTSQAPTPICPQVAVVRGLDIVRDYGAETPDPSQLIAAAKLLGTDGECEYVDQGIDVTFHANMAAKRGPRLGGSHISFPIFVAVLDPDDNVLNKSLMTAEVNFNSDGGTVNHAEALHVFIPLPKDKQSQGPHYKVLTGFQLTQAQAEEAKSALKP